MISGAPLKVTLVGPLPPPAGGMANQMRQLATLLAGEGVQVRTVRTQPPYRPAWVGRVPVLRALFRLLPYLLQLWRGGAGADVVHVMANSGWSWHLFAAPAVWLARLRGARVVLNYRGGEAGEFFARSFRWVRPTLQLVDRVVVPSEFLRQVFQRHGVATVVVPNIVDLQRFRATSRLAPREGELRLLVARNLEPLYDIETALRAFRAVRAQVPGATLAIAGDGPDRERLQRLVDDWTLGGSVTFLGQIDNQQMPAVLAATDVMVNPSLADNMPISVLEAYASGVPVVSTNVGGVPYIVDDGRTGLLVPPGDPARMADAILRLYADPELRESMVAEAARRSEGYTWREIWPRLAAVYRAEEADSPPIHPHPVKPR